MLSTRLESNQHQ